MKYYKRTLTAKDAKEFRAAVEKWVYIPKFGDARVPRGKYSICVIIYAYQGGNEWSSPRKIEQFRMYYNK